MTEKRYSIKNPKGSEHTRDLIEVTHCRVLYHDGATPKGRVIAYVPDVETAKMLKRMLTFRQEALDEIDSKSRTGRG